MERRIEYVLNNYEDNDDGLYTEESFKALTDALAEAQAVLQVRKFDAGGNRRGGEKVDGSNECTRSRNSSRIIPSMEIAVMIAEIGSNYTLEVTDYSAKALRRKSLFPIRYTIPRTVPDITKI